MDRPVSQMELGRIQGLEDTLSEQSSETKPHLFKSGKKLTAVLVADPSVTIVEVGDSFGFLLSGACYDSMMGTKFHLEDVTWIRRVKETSRGKRVIDEKDLKVRSFAEVTLYRHDAGPFVAQDMASKNYIPYPSSEPYVVVFITKEWYEKLHLELEQKIMDRLLESIRSVIQGLPGFSFEGTSLKAPRYYARAVGTHLEHGLIEV